MTTKERVDQTGPIGELKCLCCGAPATHRAIIDDSGAEVTVCTCPKCVCMSGDEILNSCQRAGA